MSFNDDHYGNNHDNDYDDDDKDIDDNYDTDGDQMLHGQINLQHLDDELASCFFGCLHHLVIARV